MNYLFRLKMILKEMHIVFIAICLTLPCFSQEKVLEYTPAPPDNPLRGLVPYARSSAKENFPHSMEFAYIALNTMMQERGQYNWEPLEKRLKEVKERGNQLIFRIYCEYPGDKISAVPQFLVDEGVKITEWTSNDGKTIHYTPDYEDEILRESLKTFIERLGAKYDGDPRIAFITAGILGSWGEWHTYPREDLWASKQVQREIMDSYAKAFKKTKILMRYPVGENSEKRAENHERPFGYHDDSFCWSTIITEETRPWYTEVQLQAAGDAAINKWKTFPMGGEIRPELWQKTFTDDRHPNDQGFVKCVERMHTSWLMDSGLFSDNIPVSPERKQTALQEVARMGYELHISKVRWQEGKLFLTVENRGVAPFYFDWNIETRIDQNLQENDWKLSGILPGEPRVWSIPMQQHQELQIRVLNPMEGGKPLRFANHTNDSGWLSITSPAGESKGLKLARFVENQVSSSQWKAITLDKNYDSAVIIATPIYPSNAIPSAVARIRNITSGGFEVKLARTDGASNEMSADVAFIVVEEGVYNEAEHGVKMEAVTYQSSVTDRKNSWNGQSRSYQNSYANPVVVGQVLSANDVDWSVFWSRGENQYNPPSSAKLYTGKHVGEDPDTDRMNETIGYIVIESGGGSIEGVAYQAAVGADTVEGMDNGITPYNYALSGSLNGASAVAVSSAGMDGGDGGWPILVGAPAFTGSNLGLYHAEDTLGDSEKFHTTEQHAYIVFEDRPSGPQLNRFTENQVSSSQWKTVQLPMNYTSPVIIATPVYPWGNTTPVVTRIKNVTGNSFELKLDRTDGSNQALSLDVSVVVVEEGVFTLQEHGVKMEVVKFVSTDTSHKGDWNGEGRTYQNTYSSPVVIGQVMSTNDLGWSVFWSRGETRYDPADSTTIKVGKHVGEDPDTTRSDETIGYIVIEAGVGTIDGVQYEAGTGNDIVRGFDTSSTPYEYALTGQLAGVSAVATSASGMDGDDGGWPAVVAPTNLLPAYSATNINLYHAEDTLRDNEKYHTTEQHAYLVFGLTVNNRIHDRSTVTVSTSAQVKTADLSSAQVTSNAGNHNRKVGLDVIPFAESRDEATLSIPVGFDLLVDMKTGVYKVVYERPRNYLDRGFNYRLLGTEKDGDKWQEVMGIQHSVRQIDQEMEEVIYEIPFILGFHRFTIKSNDPDMGTANPEP